MRRYAYSENTPMFLEQYEVTLADDGTFEWNSVVGSGRRGRWVQRERTLKRNTIT
jgi:hypothetical protein